MNESALLSPEELQPAQTLINQTLEQLDRILLGREELHRMVMVGLLSRGHLLMEGLPGLGKTALIHAIGQIMQLDFNRIQFTPDLMPGDILGNHILQQNEQGLREMVYQPGPVFTNILLADEINRASPKTQSAMLETMQERSVTLLGTTRPLPSPFFVLASQNPIELEGTYPLPEAQLDRFLFRLIVDAPSADTLEQMLTNRRRGETPEPTWTMKAGELEELFAVMDRVIMPAPVNRFIARLVAASHPESPEAPQAIKDYVTYGASPRAAIGIAEAARAHALVNGRPTAGFEDVDAVAPAVINHRLNLNYKARFDKVAPRELVHDLLKQLDAAGIAVPDGVEVAE